MNWPAAEQISLVSANAEWKLTPPTPPLFAKSPKAVTLPSKSNFFEGLTGLAINPAAQKAVVAYTFAEPKPQGQTRVVVCDLVTGKAGPPAATSGLMVPIALHDNGQHIVMRRNEFGFGNQDRLEIWTVSGTTVSRLLEWIPYEDVKVLSATSCGLNSSMRRRWQLPAATAESRCGTRPICSRSVGWICAMGRCRTESRPEVNRLVQRRANRSF